MRILIINVCCGTGSTGRICTDLATALEAMGHDVRIAYGRDQVPEQFQKYAHRIGSQADILLHAGCARLSDCAGFCSRRATKDFLRWVQEYDPDVIHLHNLHGYYLHVGLLFSYLKTCGKRIVWTLHDCWAFTGHSALCDGVSCTRWETGCQRCPQKADYPKALIDRSRQNWERKRRCFCGVPDMTLVTPSEWLAKEAKRSFLNEYPIRVIPNGINTDLFRPTGSDFRARNALGSKRMLLGVASQWNRFKGIDDFVKLAELLDSRYQIVLVGVEKNSLPGILCIRRTENIRQLAEIYSAADLFINLTYIDTYPTVNLEASACGTPVLTYATGGSPESAIVCAGIVKKGDIEAMAAAIEDYFSREHRKLPPDDGVLNRLDNKTTLASYLRCLCGEK